MKPDDIALMLPEIWQRGLGEGSVGRALVEVMAALHGSVEAAIADPSTLLDPRRAPDRLVPVLAAWVGLGHYLRTGDRGGEGPPWPGDLRELTAIAARLRRNRGNAGTLLGLLEAATGVAGFRLDEDPAQPFHFRLGIPPAAVPAADLVARIVTAEKPAFTSFEIHCLNEATTEEAADAQLSDQ